MLSSDLSRRTRKKRESRDRLIGCAADLFAEHGFEATTMEEIGECADVSRATVFNYFPRKEDLVLAWFDNRRSDFAAVLEETRASAGDTPAQLRSAFRVLARIFEDNPAAGRGMMRAWLRAGGPLMTPESDTERLLAGVIREGQARGDIASEIDPARAGRLLFDAYSGVLYRWVNAQHELSDLEQQLMAALDIVLRGLQTRLRGG